MTRWFRIFTGIRSLYMRIDGSELGLIAAGIAFFGFLAVFPALAAVIALWGFVADPGMIRQQLVLAEDFLPPEAFVLFSTQVEGLLDANSRDLGWATLVSTMVALWSARAGVAALIRGLNAIHRLPNRAGPAHLLRALLLTLTLVGVMLSAIFLAVIMPIVIGFLPLGPFAALGLEGANLALALVVVSFGIALVYRIGPNRTRRDRRLFSRGMIVAVLLWAVASRGLVIYFNNFGSYNQVYGSIGAVVALLMWLYISAYAVLLGAAVDAERSR